ncbi:MAG: fluoride efflux transporter CrcB [Candidatus Eisenbacteria bacterium]|nr:fluoride efflux transporter CrcB [Candidatus Eisenbacteria bacterium]
MSSVLPVWLLVSVAGAAGTLLRWVLGGLLARSTSGTFPWETFLINALGCLAIGIVAGMLDRGALLSPALRMALMVGFLGGFTTFSTFALEAFRLASGAEWIAASAYVVLTNGAGLLAVWLGHQVALRV